MDIAVAIEQVRRRRFPRGVDHLLVIDDEDRLIGVVNIRDLLLAESETLIEAIMSRDVAAVRADLDQEAVAEAFDRYDYYMLAVVDETGHLLGIVTVDDVIDIIREEQTEDMQRTVGAGKVEAVYSSVGEKFRGRFPWLLVNLGTVSISAVIVLNFEGLIAQLAILAVIMPVIASQAGNAGHQALAVTLRGIVLGEVRRERVWPLVAREAIVGLIAGIALGVVAALVMVVLGSAGVMEGVSYRLGIVVAAAMAISTAAGTLSGVAIPLAMRTLKADPAMGSAIFLIMVTDAVAFASFLGGANLVAGWLGVTG